MKDVFFQMILGQVPGLFLQKVVLAHSNPELKKTIRNVSLKIFQNLKVVFADDPEFQ